MGYHWPVHLKDDHQIEWVGVHRPELVDLQRLFRHLTSLSDSDDPLDAETWRAALPENMQLIRVLGEHTAHLYLQRAQTQHLVVRALSPRAQAWRWLTDSGRHSRAHRAYQWGHRLRSFGIDTPRPLGYLERAKGPGAHRSFHISELVQAPTMVEFKDDLRETLEKHADAVLEKRVVVERLGRLVAELERVSVIPTGLRAQDLLVTPDAVYLVACDSLRDGSWTQRDRVEVLAKLDRELSGILSVPDRMRFLDAYLHTRADRRARRRALFRQIQAQAPRLEHVPV